ncbi:MAG: signal peptidase I [Dehalococcoidia bacterium]
MVRQALTALLRLPLPYPLLAFLFARRVAIRGRSMYPTLAPGEYVLFDRLAYRQRPPDRGDVVLASHPSTPNVRIVKRVVALPGDRVAVEGGELRINGTPYGEGLLSGEPSPVEGWMLGEDEYFLLGDAPSLSTDARHFGPVSGKEIEARAWLVYWPPGRMRTVRGRPELASEAER